MKPGYKFVQDPEKPYLFRSVESESGYVLAEYEAAVVLDYRAEAGYSLEGKFTPGAFCLIREALSKRSYIKDNTRIRVTVEVIE